MNRQKESSAIALAEKAVLSVSTVSPSTLSHTISKIPVPHLPRKWGHETTIVHRDTYSGRILHVKQGKTVTMSVSWKKTRTLYVTSGRFVVTSIANGLTTTLIVGDVLTIPYVASFSILCEEEGDIIEIVGEQ